VTTRLAADQTRCEQQVAGIVGLAGGEDLVFAPTRLTSALPTASVEASDLTNEKWSRHLPRKKTPSAHVGGR